MKSPQPLICLLLVLLTSQPSRADEAPLVWKLQAGEQHHYRLTQQMEMTMVFQATGRAVETTFRQVHDMTWQVEQVDEQGTATIVQHVDRVQLDVEAPGEQAVHYDTSAEDNPTGFAAMMAPLLKTLTNEPITLTLSQHGEVQQVKIPTALSAAVSGAPSAKLMAEMFSEKGLRKMFQQSSLVLPEPKDLKPGYQWTRESQLTTTQVGQINTQTTYRYQGQREVKGQVFEVFTIQLKTAFPTTPNGVKMEIVSQNSQGEILFDRQRGLIHSSELTQNLNTEINAGGQAITQSLTIANTFIRVEDKQ